MRSHRAFDTPAASVRLTLDRTRNLILALPSDSEAPARLSLTLGDASLRLHILPPFTAADADIEFIAKTAVDGAQITTGLHEISAGEADDSPQVVEVGEDWSAAALVAQFIPTSTEYVDLLAAWRYRAADSDSWVSTPWLNVRVRNNLFPSEVMEGAVVLAGQYYVSTINGYTGGGSTRLDGIATVNLAIGTVLRIWVSDDGESAWRLEAGSLTTDLEAGIVRPEDFEDTANEKIWVRGAGG